MPQRSSSAKRSWWSLIQETYHDWNDDNASQHGAALAFYTVFSIAPVLVIAVMIAGAVYGEIAANQQLATQLKQYMGSQAAEAVQTMIGATHYAQRSWIAWIASIATLVFGATGVFDQLQDSLNTIWEVKTKRQGILATVKSRLSSFLLVLAIGALLLALVAASSVLPALAKTLGGVLPFNAWVAEAINLAISLTAGTVMFGLIFKVLPDVEIAWRDVWVGALVTAILFSIGKFLFGLYIGYSAIGSAYGAIGSILVLLLWAYYSAQIFFLGAEFTQCYARRCGSKSAPQPPPAPVTTEASTRQDVAAKKSRS